MAQHHRFSDAQNVVVALGSNTAFSYGNFEGKEPATVVFRGHPKIPYSELYLEFVRKSRYGTFFVPQQVNLPDLYELKGGWHYFGSVGKTTEIFDDPRHIEEFRNEFLSRLWKPNASFPNPFRPDQIFS